MKNKNQLEENFLPGYDPDQQLIAISKVIRQLTLCLKIKEKSFENTDYTKINHEYAGDLYANDSCELGFLDVAVSHSAIAIYAPFLEGLFKHEIASLKKNGRPQTPSHIRTGKSRFWEIEWFYNSKGTAVTRGKAKGVAQILDALNIFNHFPENTEEMLEIIFLYRNYTLHNGFEAETEEKTKINSKIQSNNWSNYFIWATTDGELWMLSMKKEFITKCFDFCRSIKEGFDKEKRGYIRISQRPKP